MIGNACFRFGSRYHRKSGRRAAEFGVAHMKPSKHQQLHSKPYRIVTFAFGILFVGLALAIFVVSDATLGSFVAGVLVGGLGLNAIFSAIRNKVSWLSRIGPLP